MSEDIRNIMPVVLIINVPEKTQRFGTLEVYCMSAFRDVVFLCNATVFNMSCIMHCVGFLANYYNRK